MDLEHALLACTVFIRTFLYLIFARLHRRERSLVLEFKYLESKYV
jgi:hypothetical protein